MSGLKSFASDTRGNVAMMFGLLVVAVFGISGLAIDYSRGTNVQAKMTAAADAAALAGASAQGTEDERIKVAQDMFNGAVNSIPGVSNISFKGENLKTNGVVSAFKVTANLKLETMVGKLFGQEKLTIGVKSEATLGADAIYEIALVLDTTGSMAGAKLEALKVAAKDLVSKLTAKMVKPDQVKFAIVPFSQWVNVGMANRNASWLDVPADYSETKTVDSYAYPNKTLIGCSMQDVTHNNDGVTTTTQQEVCTYDWGTPVITPVEQTYEHKWNGCVGSRNAPLNTQDDTYSTKVPGLLDRWCPGEILPLTSDVSAINASIDSMYAYGNTYIPSGLIWGWRALSAERPFQESKKNTNSKINQVMIVMTDGANSVSAQYPDHWGSDVADANAVTSQVCANINASSAGIKVFSIAFEVSDTAVKSILQACAGNDPARFFDAGNSTQMSEAFTKIAESMSKLRLQR